MTDDRSVPGPEFEYQKVQRVSVIVEMNVGNKRYILLLRNKSREEYEVPGGTMESSDPVKEGVRELTEETGLDLSGGNIQILPQDVELNLDLLYRQTSTLVLGGKGKKDIKSHLLLARFTRSDLPELSVDLSEHSDYMFVEIPQKWGTNDRAEFRAMARQFRSRKLVYYKQKKGKISTLNITDNEYIIQGREPNISELTSLALLSYLESRFSDLS